jgi:hypothetical protein
MDIAAPLIFIVAKLYLAGLTRRCANPCDGGEALRLRFWVFEEIGGIVCAFP